MDKFSKYKARMDAFTENINDVDLADTLKKIPAEKHFWITQLTDARRELYKMEINKKRIEAELSGSAVSGSKVLMTKGSLDEQVKAKMEEYLEKIQDQKFLIEWLELTCKTVSFYAQDFKNIIDLKKLEEA